MTRGVSKERKRKEEETEGERDREREREKADMLTIWKIFLHGRLQHAHIILIISAGGLTGRITSQDWRNGFRPIAGKHSRHCIAVHVPGGAISRDTLLINI